MKKIYLPLCCLIIITFASCKKKTPVEKIKETVLIEGFSKKGSWELYADTLCFSKIWKDKLELFSHSGANGLPDLSRATLNFYPGKNYEQYCIELNFKVFFILGQNNAVSARPNNSFRISLGGVVVETGGDVYGAPAEYYYADNKTIRIEVDKKNKTFTTIAVEENKDISYLFQLNEQNDNNYFVEFLNFHSEIPSMAVFDSSRLEVESFIIYGK